MAAGDAAWAHDAAATPQTTRQTQIGMIFGYTNETPGQD
jgi:hypothetical protein